MEKRIAVIGIIVENTDSVEKLNSLLHEFGSYIIGRMGLPYKERNLNIVSIAVHAPQDATYYILSIARAQGLDLRQSPIYLIGGPAGQSDAAVRELLRKYAEQVYCVNPTGEFNRHIVSTTPGVPYDMMTLILNSER